MGAGNHGYICFGQFYPVPAKYFPGQAVTIKATIAKRQPDEIIKIRFNHA